VTWKPFARLCGACGLGIAVAVGDEHEHLHVETHLSPAFFRVDNVVVTTTASAGWWHSRS
jgi:hypothetical protein